MSSGISTTSSRAPEHELAGVDHEGLVVADLDHLGEVVGRRGEVDRRHAEVVEDAEGPAQAQVDEAGWTIAGSQGSILIRPSSTRRRIVPSERTEVGIGAASLSGTTAGARAPWRPPCARAAGRAAAGSPCGPRRGVRGNGPRGCGGVRLPPSPDVRRGSSSHCLIAHHTMYSNIAMGIFRTSISQTKPQPMRGAYPSRGRCEQVWRPCGYTDVVFAPPSVQFPREGNAEPPTRWGRGCACCSRSRWS